MTNPWLHPKLPRGPASALAALHLAEPASITLSDAEWRAALGFCDQAHLTLALREAARDSMPDWVRERTDQDAEKNRERVRRAEAVYRSLQECMAVRGVEFLALKGLAHTPEFTPQPELRVQYDIDLYVPADAIEAARAAVIGLGYESFEEMEAFPTDHLPPLIRKTGWEWRGDFFDVEIPYSVELHHQFWGRDLERIEVPDVEQFWGRRVERELAGVRCQVLDPVDALGYCCLHLLKHVLQGSAKPGHVYELAGFLQRHASDEAFWLRWRTQHSAEFRRLQAVAFRVASEWVGCEAPAVALSRATERWFARANVGPAGKPFGAGKQELGLHLSLVESRRDGWAVVRRRLFPARLPGPVDAVHVSGRLGARRWRRKWMRYAGYVASRAGHHAAALPGVALTLARWKLRWIDLIQSGARK